MSSNTDQLRRLRETDPDVALLLNIYEEAEQIYRGALEAMGRTSSTLTDARNTSEVMLSVEPLASSTSKQPLGK